jgi:glycine hydroxymethyltransferase
VTTRGFGPAEIDLVAGWLADLLEAPASEATIAGVRAGVMNLCSRYPVYA